MSGRRIALGRAGESLAAAYLRKKGYRIVGRNVRFRQGEIDLIALDGRMLVFVEVRTRTSERFGTPAESVTPSKQRKLRELALAYLCQRSTPIAGFRFDVVAIVLTDGQPQIRHIPAAF